MARGKVRDGELPFQVGKGLTDRLSGDHGVSDSKLGTWNTVVRAAQGNFDHLMGVIRELIRGHNTLVDDFNELAEAVESGEFSSSGGSTGSDGGDHAVTDHGDASPNAADVGDVLMWDGVQWAAAPELRNQFALVWGSKVTVVAADQGQAIAVPWASRVLHCYVTTPVAPSTGDFVVDVKKNGTTIYGTAANPKVTTGNTVGANAAPDATTLAAHDTLTVTIDSLGGMSTGRVYVFIVCEVL